MRSTDDQSTIRWLPVVGLYCFRGLKIDFNQNLSLCDRCTKSVRVHQLCKIFRSHYSRHAPLLSPVTSVHSPSVFADPDKIGQLLSDSIFEAHQRTCLLSRDQIQVGCSQGISDFKVEQFKKMVSTLRLEFHSLY